MGRRLVGSLMFLGTALFLFEIAGRMALTHRAGWGWFVFAGLVQAGVALNLWSEDMQTPRCRRCEKPPMSDDLQ
jgi:hypothetical protein